MALLFACSASVQLNDPGTILASSRPISRIVLHLRSLNHSCNSFLYPDWYLWFLFYASAAAVKILQTSMFTSKNSIKNGQSGSSGGVALFVKVLVEAHLLRLAGFWSLDMRERFVREKVGSGFLVASMYLHLNVFEASKGSKRKEVKKDGVFVAFGMAALVALSSGSSLYFFAFIKDNMK